MPGGTFQDCCCQCPPPCGEPLPTHANRRPSNSSTEFWFSLLCGHCSFSLGLGACKILFVPCKSGVLHYLVPPVLWKSYNQILLAFKVRFPGNSQSLGWIPRLGSLTWGSEPSQQWENSFCIIVLQFMGHQPVFRPHFSVFFFCFPLL